MIQGFAHVDKYGVIDIATVSPTERAAMVNAIVTLSGGVLIPRDTMEYSEIEARYLNLAVATGGSIKPVTITTEIAE